MRIFYTGIDIEDLAASGAEDLGIALVTPGNAPASKTIVPVVPAKRESLPSRPRGCQHGPLPRASSQGTAISDQGPVLDRLVETVSALTKRGG